MVYLGHSLHFKPSLHIVNRGDPFVWQLYPLVIKAFMLLSHIFPKPEKNCSINSWKKSSVIFLDFKTCLERFAGYEVFPSSISSLSDCWSCQNARLVWFVWSLVSSWRLRWEPEVASFCKQGNDAADFLLFSPDFPLQSEHSELLRCEKGHLVSIPG